MLLVRSLVFIKFGITTNTFMLKAKCYDNALFHHDCFQETMDKCSVSNNEQCLGQSLFPYYMHRKRRHKYLTPNTKHKSSLPISPGYDYNILLTNTTSLTTMNKVPLLFLCCHSDTSLAGEKK